MNGDSVSVVLPTFNRAPTLGRAIDSVLAQTHRDLELLVVDDGSTDATAALMASVRDARVRYLPQSANRGPAAARNAGVREARFPLVAFQDSDDEWLPRRLERQIAVLREAGAETALVSCGLVRHSPSSRYVFPPRALLVADSRAATRSTAVAFTQTWLVRRHAFDRIGGFDERLTIWEDWEWLLRFCDQFNVVYLDETLVHSHTSRDSVSSNVNLRIHDLGYIMSKHASTDPDLESRMRYLLGRLNLLKGDTTAARHALWRSLRLRPRRTRAWALLALSCFGANLPRAVLDWRTRRTHPVDGGTR